MAEAMLCRWHSMMERPRHDSLCIFSPALISPFHTQFTRHVSASHKLQQYTPSDALQRFPL